MTTPAVPASPRVLELLGRMTIEEKVAQLVGFWIDQGDDVVAPMAGEMKTSTRFEDAITDGIGHFTRVYGTRPVDPQARAEWLWAEQRRLQIETRLGIPALVHEECLTGLAAWKAATFPTPLAWGAAFDPDAVEEMGRLIGASMRELGIHQGLAPVLDVIRDPRWGRVDECIAEDPYVVGTIATAYVRGLQDEGVHATLKHFVGYSATQAGRNHAPVHAGRREIEDVFLPPFEMAVRDGGVRSVMNSYAEIDGVPVAASREYLTELLRERWGFDGVVVSDYFSVAFLKSMHAVAADLGEAAQIALEAGIDVELPTGDAFLALADRVRDGILAPEVLDLAVTRVLVQKEELGLLDADFSTPPTDVDLDTPAHRALARRLAEEGTVLLTNDGVLPLAPDTRRIAVVGPNADSAEALMGCYSFANHVLAHHPGTEMGFEIPTVLEALRTALPDAEITHAVGCAVEGEDTSGIAEAVDLARGADVAVVVVGDRAGLFGRGTVGEGNDVESLDLPGAQRALVQAVASTGTPVVMVMLTGRPYAIAWAVEGEGRPGAVVQAFFPGEEGGTALARILTGAVSPSGRLPVSLPRSAGAQPYSYLHPLLSGPSDVTSADSTPVLPFGHGLSYASFRHEDLTTDAEVRAGRSFRVSVTVRNDGAIAADDIVQLYGHDLVGSITRPTAQLLAYRRVALQPGQSMRVTFEVPTQRLAFSDRSYTRIVEPGEVDLWVGPSSAVRETTARITITGDVHRVHADDPRVATSVVSSLPRTADVDSDAVPAGSPIPVSVG